MNRRPANRQAARFWRLAVVEDHLLQRLRTEELLRSQRGFRLVHSGETLREFVSWLEGVDAETRPHLLILDLVVDRGEDADPALVAEIIEGGIQVVVLSAMASPPLVREMIRVGVTSIIGKRDDEAEVISVIWSALGQRQWMTPELAAVLAGDADRPGLSSQEERVLVLYASGLTLDAVAEEMGIRPETAKTYLRRIKQKYAERGRSVRTKVDLHRVALDGGYLSEADLSEAGLSEADP